MFIATAAIPSLVFSIVSIMNCQQVYNPLIRPVASCTLVPLREKVDSTVASLTISSVF